MPEYRTDFPWVGKAGFFLKMPRAQAIFRLYRTPLPFAAGATPKMVD